KEANLGRDIVTQMTAFPKVFTIAAVLLLGMAAVPGLPKVPFIVLAALMGGYAFYSTRKREQKVQEVMEQPREEKVKKAIEKHGDQLPFIMPSPISLEVGSAIIPFVDDSKDGGRFINE